MFYRKILPSLLISVAAAMSLPSAAQQSTGEDHSAHHPESGNSKSSPQMKRGGKGMKGGMGGMDACPMHDDMMSSMSTDERHAMMEQRIKSMTPEMRKKRLAKMEQHMQMMQDQMQMMRDHMNDPVTPGTGNAEHEHQQ
jgi:hypothetical protein